MPKIIKFWKPYDVLTQFTDPQGRATLADYIDIKHVYAAGRLDRDSEGLLLLTDDNRLKTRLTEPRYAHPRTYWVQVEHIPDEAALGKLRHGLELNDGWTLPTQVERLHQEPELPPRDPPIRVRQTVPDCWISLTLTEGRNRQVRRMTAAVGHPTLRLVRWAIGSISLAGMKPGEWQYLTAAELASLDKVLKAKAGR
ncbi:MAG: pseudouridine synthase [Chloroflexi bacterium]|nr:pseudouridine synthase [Chloroflexota bacterium]MCC6896957.1 pseudouridine synthase [Anaerolineae bacterium]